MKETLKNTTNRNVYHRLYLNELYPPYWDEGISGLPKRVSWRSPSWHRGTVRSRKKKSHLPYKYRMYKTWKHNRKHQWKPK
jgi:hypothetical protein